MLSVVMLTVNSPYMLGVVMLSVVAPLEHLALPHLIDTLSNLTHKY